MTKRSSVGQRHYHWLTLQAVKNAQHIKRRDVQEVSGQLVSSRTKVWSNGAYALVFWKNGDALALTRSGKFLLLKGNIAVEVTISKSAWEHFKKVYRLGDKGDGRSGSTSNS